VRFAPHAGIPEGTGWTTVGALASRARLEPALDDCGASFGTDRRDIQGQRLVEVVTWCLAVPAAHALLHEQPTPDLSADNALVWIGPDPPDGVAAALRTPRATDTPARELLDAHLQPLIEAVHAATQRPRKALRRAVKDRVDAAVAWVADLTGTRERALALLAETADVRVFDAGTHDTLLHVRQGCCLYYRTPAAVKCFGCPLLSDDDRRRLVAGGGQ